MPPFVKFAYHNVVTHNNLGTYLTYYLASEVDEYLQKLECVKGTCKSGHEPCKVTQPNCRSPYCECPVNQCTTGKVDARGTQTVPQLCGVAAPVSCIDKIIAHNDAAVELAHERLLQINELRLHIDSLQKRLNELYRRIGSVQSQARLIVKDPMRADFEAWATKQDLGLFEDAIRRGEYRSLKTQARWVCWQAAYTTVRDIPGMDATPKGCENVR